MASRHLPSQVAGRERVREKSASIARNRDVRKTLTRRWIPRLVEEIRPCLPHANLPPSHPRTFKANRRSGPSGRPRPPFDHRVEPVEDPPGQGTTAIRELIPNPIPGLRPSDRELPQAGRERRFWSGLARGVPSCRDPAGKGPPALFGEAYRDHLVDPLVPPARPGKGRVAAGDPALLPGRRPQTVRGGVRPYHPPGGPPPGHPPGVPRPPGRP